MNYQTVTVVEDAILIVEVAQQGPPGLNGAAPYTNLAPTPSAVGGIAAGSTFDGVPLNTMLDTLLYPYQTPGFSSFSFSGITTPLEVGGTLPAARTFSWGMTNTANVAANSTVLTLFDGSTTSGLGVSGSTATASAAETLTSPGSRSASIRATNSKGGLATASLSVQWLWRKFSGSSADAALTVPVGSGVLSSAASGTYVFGAAAGTYKYIMYPASFGTLSSFKDQSTNLDIPFSAAYTVSITNSFGVATSYRIHRSLNQLGGAINIVAA